MTEATPDGPAFVTGGTGFVGGAVVRALRRQGREVRALVRDQAGAQRMEEAGAGVVRGDLLRPETLAADMEGCASVFHVAGMNAMCLRDPAPMLRVNVAGTESVLRAAAEAGVPRVILTSSAATIGEAPGVVADEDTPHRGSFLSAYERSKYLAEERARALGPQLGVEVVSVNPSSVQGPGRTRGSARLLLDLVRGKLPVLVETWLSIVDVEDCAAGHLAAEARGQGGRRYLLNGATLSTRGALAMLRTVWGRPDPGSVRFVPRAVVRAAGPLTGLAGLAGQGDDPSICPEMVRTLLHGHRYDGSRAARELGVHYTPVEETVRRTLAWYTARGLAPGPGPGRAASHGA